MLRIERNSVDGRLNRNTFCSGTECAPVQLARDLYVLQCIIALQDSCARRACY